LEKYYWEEVTGELEKLKIEINCKGKDDKKGIKICNCQLVN
jgi:hypothetical protein